MLLEKIIDEPDYEWLMIDASHAKVHLGMQIGIIFFLIGFF